MTLGEMYIKDSYINEMNYEEAIEASKTELKKMGIKSREDIYDNEELLDSPIYPANAELYNEFCDEHGFYTEGYFSFIAKRIELE